MLWYWNSPSCCSKTSRAKSSLRASPGREGKKERRGEGEGEGEGEGREEGGGKEGGKEGDCNVPSDTRSLCQPNMGLLQPAPVHPSLKSCRQAQEAGPLQSFRAGVSEAGTNAADPV